MNFALWLYRRLARAFPHEFQVIYGADIIQLGEDIVQDIAKQNGIAGLFRLIFDLAIRVPAEYLSEMRRDVAYAARTLVKSPGFAAVGVLSLGLGIGVTSTIYSEIHMLIFHDLPVVREPQRLVMLQGVSYPYYEEFRKQNLFTGVAAFETGVPFSVVTNPASPRAERIFGQIVSPDFFSVFGVSAERGRMFSDALDQPGEAPVAVVTHRFWTDRLGSDPNAVGRVLRINGQSATIVGIAPKDFLGAMPIVPSDIFIPTTSPARLAPELGDDVLHKRDQRPFMAVFRLAPGVQAASAEAALDTLTKHLDESSADPADRDRKGRKVKLVPGGMIFPVPNEAKPILWGMWGTLVGLMLTIACMNLANMLLAKAGARRREIAIRLAVGASRWRLIRQLVTESVILSMAGGVLGLVFAFWMTNAVSAMKLPGSTPFQFDIRPDAQVFVFTLLLSILTGIGFGLAPAFAATKADVAPTLKEGGVSQMRGYKRFGMRNLLVVYQVAGSLMLLLITGFMVLGYGSFASANASFDTHTMYLTSIDPIRDGYTPDQTSAFFEKLPERLRTLPGVDGVALAGGPPFTQEVGASEFSTGTGMTSVGTAAKQIVGSGYFATLNEKMLAGREFDERDQRADASASTVLPAILNQAAAQSLFGNESPIGKRITQQPQSFEVVGLVRDLKGPSITPGFQGIIYLPMTRRLLAHPGAGGLTLMIRSNAGTDSVERVRTEIAAIDPNITLFNTRSLYESLDALNAYVRLGTIFYGGLGVFGLILASIGLAGVTAYAVTQRRKEIGIRMALGAKKSQVLMLVLREGTAMVVIGSILGFGGALVLARAMSAILNVFSQVFHTGASDPKLIVGAPLLLAGLAMLACYLPARKSTEIDPLKALREE